APGAAAVPVGGSSRRNLLLITVDTTRADHLGCYGYEAGSTPAIDALAGRGALFEKAYTPSVLTLPSHTTIMTGRIPPDHGVRNNGTDRLGDGAVTLAEVLRKSGWSTAAFVGGAVLDAAYGLDQGFGVYDDSTAKEVQHTVGYAERDAMAVTDAALSWLGTRPKGPWFLWVHYFDPHAPYRPPEPFASRFAGHPYDGEIAYADSGIAKLLAAVQSAGETGRTITVLVADHGEGLDQHGEETHGVFLYNETTRVPMIISAPGLVPAPKRLDPIVRTTDLMPTILDLLGVAVPGRLDGVSLRPLLDGGALGKTLTAYSEAVLPAEMYGWSPMASLRSGKWKYIAAPRPELYDLDADPGETHDLAAAEPDQAGRLRADLVALLKAVGGGASRSERVTMTEEQEARLRSLGYVSGSNPTFRQSLDADPLAILSGGSRGLPDPKDKVAMLERIEVMLRSYGQGRLDDAVEQAGAILRDNPDNNLVRTYLAAAYRRQEKLDLALAEYKRLIQRQPENIDAWVGEGWTLMKLGRYDEAKAAYDHVLGVSPKNVDAMSSLGSLYFIEGDFDKAQELFERVLRSRPDHVGVIQTLARIAGARGRPDQAEAYMRRAIAAEPDNPGLVLGLAAIQLQGPHPESALETLSAAVTAHPDRPEILVARGDVYVKLGRLDEAEADYQKATSLAPRAPQGYHALGRLAARRGDKEAARRLFQKALSLDPHYQPARDDLARLGGS
ncbi:MAG TPA: sulfatase-like hydrolase/transferase, partial [Candidatus Saccharimonadales bacterium]|nr:sulfatase-like hydrolase/transferase [Candidatus Saccharimonadales bacterium]